MKTLSKILPAILALATATASAQARLGLDVVDSADKKVGYASDPAQMVIFIEGEPYLIGASHDGFTPGGLLFFDQSDCAGTPYIPVGSLDSDSDSPSLVAGAFFTPTDGLLHYSSAASQVSRHLMSQLIIYPNGTTFCDNSYFAFARLVAPELTTPSPFAPQFRVVEAWPVSPAPATATFNDVPVSHPFFRYIEALAASGITAGCGSGNFCPNSPVSRGQMAVFLAKALGL